MAKTFGPYSSMTKAGGFYFISGQVGISQESAVDETVAAQTHQVLQNMKTVLEASGLSMSDVVKTTVFLLNMDDFKTVNEIYTSYFPEPRPARSCVEVSSLPQVSDTELLIEIEAVAYKDVSG